jgi:hypothetical protein
LRLKLIFAIILIDQFLRAGEDLIIATQNYLTQEQRILPVKSVLIHPQQRSKVLGTAYFSRPVLPFSYISTQGRFKIHYTLTGYDAVDPTCTNLDGVPDYVYQAALIAERCYSLLYDTLGLDAPPADGYDGDQIDFYIKNWNGATYAETYPENEVTATSRPYDYTAYTIIDNDYNEYMSKGLAGLQVTIAHELFHIFQLGYSWWQNNGLPSSSSDAYFLEWNSTWFEEYAYPEVNDYFYYLSYYFSNPVMPLWSDTYSYALGPFFRMIVERADALFVKRVWERIKSEYALTALEKEINSSIGLDISRLWHEFGWRNYFTGMRYDERYALSTDAAQFPLLTIPIANRGNFTPESNFQTTVQPYAHQPFLLSALTPIWVQMRAEFANASSVMGSYIISNQLGTTVHTLGWHIDVGLGRFDSGDLLFALITNGSKNQSNGVTLAFQEMPDSAQFTTKIKVLFPNPLFRGDNQDLYLQLQTSRSVAKPVLRFFNLRGEQVLEWRYREPLKGGILQELIIPAEVINARNLPSGVYFVGVDCGFKTVYHRLIYLR